MSNYMNENEIHYHKCQDVIIRYLDTRTYKVVRKGCGRVFSHTFSEALVIGLTKAHTCPNCGNKHQDIMYHPEKQKVLMS